MLQPDQMRQFVKDYEEYARSVLRPNRDELKKVFRSWKDPNHWAPPRRNESTAGALTDSESDLSYQATRKRR
jgi:hypothetical protein